MLCRFHEYISASNLTDALSEHNRKGTVDTKSSILTHGRRNRPETFEKRVLTRKYILAEAVGEDMRTQAIKS